jgi:hypothetical protein
LEWKSDKIFGGFLILLTFDPNGALQKEIVEVLFSFFFSSPIGIDQIGDNMSILLDKRFIRVRSAILHDLPEICQE